MRTTSRWKLRTLCLLAGMLLALAGCSAFPDAAFSPSASPLIRFEQPSRTRLVLLQPGSSLGQSFVSRYGGLEGLSFWLERGSTAGDLQLHLRASPESSDDLASATLPLSQVGKPGFYAFRFPPLQDSNHASYYALLELQDGTVQAGAAGGETYAEGSLYQAGEAKDAQATFRLAFERAGWLLGLASDAARSLGYLLLGLFLVLLPGWSLLSLLFDGWIFLSAPEKIGLAAGAGMALYPLLFLWTGLLGLRLGNLYAWLLPLAALLLIAWRSRRQVLGFQLHPVRLDWFPGAGAAWSSAAYLVVAVILAATRLLPVWNLAAPMWGDSYQHSLITQLLLDHGGLFQSWQPYTELTQFTYHFGFHSLAASFAWIAGMSAQQAVLWTGQIVNILAVLAIYPLATRISGQRWAGLAAVIFAGFASPMPMVYINWGRFTQLAGQVILPALIYLTWEAARLPRSNRKLAALTAVLFGGLALTHYRILVLALIFLVVILASYILSRKRLVSLAAWFATAGTGGFILFIPWFIRVYGQRLAAIFASEVTTAPAHASQVIEEVNSTGSLLTYLPAWMWLAFALAAGWSLWRRERQAVSLTAWFILSVLAANPQWLGLPGAGVISSFTVFLLAYLPASVLAGAAVGWLVAAVGCYGQRFFPPAAKILRTPSPGISPLPVASGLLAGLAVAFALLGVRPALRQVRPGDYALVTHPDLRAAGWLRVNTPQDAGVLVNAFPAYGGSAFVGADAGWWLPLLAGRAANIPPLNYTLESEPWPGYFAWVNALPQAILAGGIDSPPVLEMLKERGIRYAYIGQLHGRVNNPGQPLLQPESLLASQHYRPVYHQDQVWVFEVLP